MENLLKYLINYNTNSLLIIQSVLIILIPFLIWKIKIINKWIPLVVVQIVTGIILGHSVLGTVAPSYFKIMWPEDSLKVLKAIGLIAVIFFSFIIGVEFKIPDFRKKLSSLFITSFAAIIVPFLMCGTAALYISLKYPELTSGSSIIPFITGIALVGSVTALPVLSSIISELKYNNKNTGITAIAAATINDGFIWLCLSVIIAISNDSGNFITTLKIILLIPLFFFIMFFIVKKMLINFVKKGYTKGIMTVIVAILFLSAFSTELIGVHYFLGAFIAGTVVPRSITEIIQEKMDDFLKEILMPFFFVTLGLNLNFSISDKTVILIFTVLSLSAIIGKIGGSAVAAKLTGVSETIRESLIFGNFMSCKGMIGIVVLNILFEAGIIEYRVFSALILMNILTILITKPLHILLEHFRSSKINA